MKTLLIDDHPLFREGLALLMTHAFPQLLLRQAGGLSEALACIADEPDIELVLLDLGLPDSAGMQGLQRLRTQAPQVTVVVLSANESPETVLAAIDAGAAGFIPKTSRLGAMQTALQVVLAGGVYLPDSVLGPAASLATPLDEVGEGDTLGLSPRQLDVLKLLIEGKPNKLICRELELSESTVKTHLAAIFRKLNASSRTQAVVAAARLGLRLGDTTPS
ncbi:MAG: response regulator transcription factor [Rhizobacter sp.]|nr:response regulator transcription factor [Rhizobacter sp.]